MNPVEKINLKNIFLDSIIWSLLIIIASMFVRGGWYVRLGPVLLDFSDFKLYGGVLGVLLYFRCPPFLELLWNRLKIWAFDKNRAGRRVAILLGTSFGLLMGIHLLRHWTMNTDACDLFFLHQPLFYPWGRVPLKCDLCNGGSFLGEHLAWTLFLLTPLTSWIQVDELVFLLKIIAVLLPIALALKYGPVQKKNWVFVSILLLCIMPLRNSIIWDFREDDLAFAFSFGTVVSLYQGWIGRYLIFLVLVLLTKENYAFITAFLVIPISWESALKLKPRQRRFLATATAFLSLFWGFISFKYLIPHYSHQETQNNIVLRFPGYGATPIEIVWTLLTSPTAWWRLIHEQILTSKAALYLSSLFMPFIYFLRYSPTWILAVLPGVFMNVLSSSDNQRSFLFHYELIFLPYLIFGTWLGIGKIETKRKLNWAIPLLLGVTFFGSWPTRFMRDIDISIPLFRNATYLRTLPDDGSITGANKKVLGQLSRFREARDMSLILEHLDPSREELMKATRMIIDRTNQQEEMLSKELLAKNWKWVSTSPDGRYRELRKYIK